jgi:hypothetical protein
MRVTPPAAQHVFERSGLRLWGSKIRPEFPVDATVLTSPAEQTAPKPIV